MSTDNADLTWENRRMSDLWDFRDAVNKTHASGILGNVRSGGSSTPALDPGLALRAARKVASMSKDAEECAEMLAMLGLTAEMGKHEVEAA